MRKALLILLTFILLLAPIQVGCGYGEISRLSFPERLGGFSGSTIIKNQTALDDFISDIQNQSQWSVSRKAEFLQNVNAWRINFSTHNLILYRHNERSGSIVVNMGIPRTVGIAVVINVNREFPMILTDDMASHYYAYKVGKCRTSAIMGHK